MNLEDDNSMKRLVADCQSRGISPSSLKHLKYLRRFLAKVSSVRMQQPLGGGGGEVTADPLATLVGTALSASSNHSSSFSDAPESVEVTVDVNPNHKGWFNS